MAKGMQVGGGGRFAALAAKVGPAVAASIGRKKYGKKGMAKMAAKGRKRAASKKDDHQLVSKLFT